jgi:Na+/phosphate symporter
VGSGRFEEKKIMTEEKVQANPFRVLVSEVQSESSGEALGREDVSAAPSMEDALCSMLDDIIEMIRLLSSSLAGGSTEEMDRCELLAKRVHSHEKTLTMRLLDPSLKDRLPKDLLRFPYRLERVGDMLENILTCSRLKARDAIPFSKEAHADLDDLFSRLIEMMTTFKAAFVSPRPDLLESVIGQGTSIAEALACARAGHWERLWAGFCDPHASSKFLDILDSIKWTNEYIKKLAATLLELVT